MIDLRRVLLGKKNRENNAANFLSPRQTVLDLSSERPFVNSSDHLDNHHSMVK
jgi:hypothetical protein